MLLSVIVDCRLHSLACVVVSVSVDLEGDVTNDRYSVLCSTQEITEKILLVFILILKHITGLLTQTSHITYYHFKYYISH